MATFKEKLWRTWAAIKEAETIHSVWMLLPETVRSWITGGVLMSSIFWGVLAWIWGQHPLLIAFWAFLGLIAGLMFINQWREFKSHHKIEDHSKNTPKLRQQAHDLSSEMRKLQLRFDKDTNHDLWQSQREFSSAKTKKEESGAFHLSSRERADLMAEYMHEFAPLRVRAIHLTDKMSTKLSNEVRVRFENKMSMTALRGPVLAGIQPIGEVADLLDHMALALPD